VIPATGCGRQHTHHGLYSPPISGPPLRPPDVAPPGHCFALAGGNVFRRIVGAGVLPFATESERLLTAPGALALDGGCRAKLPWVMGEG
jgi:hypothetical protein